MDWSCALLTAPERVVFRRLAALMGGFVLNAAQAVAGGGGDIQRFQVVDQLTLLVDKSLVVADNSGGATRYRLLATVRPNDSKPRGQAHRAPPGLRRVADDGPAHDGCIAGLCRYQRLGTRGGGRSAHVRLVPPPDLWGFLRSSR